MKKLITLVSFAMLAGCIFAQTNCVTFQQGATKATGALIWSLEATQNSDFTSSDELIAQHWTWNGVPGEQRSLFQFDLSQIPQGSVITSAQLSLFADSTNSNSYPGEPTYGNNNASYLHLVTSFWDAATVTWNTQPTASNSSEVLLPQSSNYDENYLNIDISSFVQTWVNTPSQNYGMLLEMITQNYYNAMVFCSPGKADSSKWPKLVICYTPRVGCQAQAAFNQQSLANGQVQFTNTSTDNTTFTSNWTFYNNTGQFASSTSASPVITFTGQAPYSAMLIITDSLCSDTLSQSVTVNLSNCVTFQQGATKAAGALIWSLDATQNADFTSWDELIAQHWTWDGVPGEERSLIKFDLSQIPPGAVITGAQLSLFADSTNSNSYSGKPTYGNNNASYLHLVTSSWDAATVTWNTQPTASNSSEVLLPQSSNYDENYLNIDISSFVQTWVNTPSQNYGMLLEMITQNYYNAMVFCSPDYVDSAKWPKLVVCYTSPIGCHTQAAFNQQSLANGQVQFTNTSTDNTTFTSNWTFYNNTGQFASSTSASPVITFTGQAPYSAMLIITDSLCSDTLSQSVTVNFCVTFQQGATKAAGALIWSLDATQNADFTSWDELIAQQWTWDGVPGEERSLIKFDLSQIPPGAVITGAQLSLFADSTNSNSYSGEPTYGNNNASYLHLVTSSWDAATVTWNTQPTASNSSEVLLPQSSNYDENYLNIDISSFVQTWVSNPSQNYGILLQMITRNYYNAMVFCSPSYGDSAKWPQLVVCYTTSANCANPPSASINSASGVICAGGKDTLTASGGSSYLWSTGDTSSTIIKTLSSETTYTVTVSTGANCTASAVNVVNVYNEFTAGINPSSVTTCPGQPVTLVANSGFQLPPVSYQWSSGDTSASITKSPVASTTYTVTATIPSGCSSSVSALVTVTSTPAAGISGVIAICPGNSTTLTASTGSSYLWSTGATTPSITISPASTAVYHVSVSYATGCVSTDSVTVNVYGTGAITPQSSTVCAGDSTILTASGGSAFSWSQGATTASIKVSPSTTTTYSVTVTNNIGCTGLDTVSAVVNINAIPAAQIIASANSICVGGSVSLTASGGTGYTCSTGDTGAVINKAPESTSTYTVTVSNANQCTAAASGTVAVYGIVAVTPSAASICAGSSVSLTATGGTNYTWSSSDTGAIITKTPIGTTDYTVTATESGLAGCSGTAAAVVTVNPLPITAVSPADSSVCSGSTIVLTANGGAKYRWSSGDTATVINKQITQTSTYTVTVTNTSGCSASASSLITEIGLPSVTISPVSPTICAGNAIGLTVNGNGTYLWSTGDTSSSISVSPVVNTIYSVTAVNSQGCSSTASRVVSVNDAPTASISPSMDSICVGVSVTYTASANASYSWSTGNTTRSITVTPGSGSIYSVTVTGSNTCTASASFHPVVSEKPANLNVSSNSPVIAGSTLSLTSSADAGVIYNWTGPNGFSANVQNPAVDYVTSINAGVYTVIPLINGCVGNPGTTTVLISSHVQANVLTFFMDTVADTSGGQVIVNVRVLNFNKILSAQGTISFDNSVLSFVQTANYGINSLSASDFGTNHASIGYITFAWTDPLLAGVTLSNDTAFFSLVFNVIGHTGQSSTINFLGAPTLLEFVDTSYTAQPYIVQPGLVDIITTDMVSGFIEDELGAGIQTATVTASGSGPTTTYLTDTTGEYTFGLGAGSTYTITPAKDNDSIVTNGVTTLDYLLIQRFILGTGTLSTPYKIIAADVNSSGTVTSLDLLLIQSLILGNITSFPPDGRLWAFVPANYVFPNPQDPFPFPRSITLTNLSAQTGLNFIGCKLGSVDDLWNPALRSAVSTVNLDVPILTAAPQTAISVPVKADNFENISGMQCTIEWDPSKLQFTTINRAQGALGVEYGVTKISEGKLAIAWTDPNYGTTTLPDESALFYLTFKIIGTAGESSPVRITSSMAEIQLVDNEMVEDFYTTTNGRVNIELSTGLYANGILQDPIIQVSPNPFVQTTNLRFELFEYSKVNITVYDELGQMIEQREGNYNAGTYKQELGNNLAEGIYFIRFVVGDYEQTLKVMNLAK